MKKLCREKRLERAFFINEFLTKWIDLEEERELKVELIHQELTYWKTSNKELKSFFESKKGEFFILLFRHLAMLKPIKDHELINFIKGIVFSLVGISMGKQRETKIDNEIEELTRPSIDILAKFWSSEERQKIMLMDELSGNDVLELNNIKTTITDDEIIFYANKYNLPLIFPKDIPDIMKVLVDHKKFLCEKISSSIEISKIDDAESQEINIPHLTFDNESTIDKLYNSLKVFFPNQENDLNALLSGREIDRKLLFILKQNKFIEVFRRLKYNRKLSNSYQVIREWICTNFSYLHVKGAVEEIRDMNANTVWDVLVKGRGEPMLDARIINEDDWLPYKSPSKLKRDKNAEKISR